jgi:hypothetical protein
LSFSNYGATPKTKQGRGFRLKRPRAKPGITQNIFCASSAWEDTRDVKAALFTLRHAETAGGNAQTWIIPEAAHCDGPIQRPEEYAARTIQFFDSAFGITR